MKSGLIRQNVRNSNIFDLIFEYTSDLIALTDAEGRLLERSKAFDTAFRLPESTQASIFVSDFLNDRSVYDYRNILIYVLRERKPVTNFKLQTNSLQPISTVTLTAALVELPARKEPAILHLFNKADNKFPSSFDYIEKLTNIGQIAAGMAHELNTPLGSIILSAGIISETASQEEVARESASIKDRAVHCSRVVKDLLSYVRREEKTFKSYMLTDIVQKVIGLVAREAERRNITLDVESCNGDIAIHCEENQIEQLFFNLLTNAFHAIENDGAVRIAFGRDELLRQALVKVSDTGKGIPPENLEAIFDPFFTTKPSGQGTGLGLALCKKIVYEHNGTIRATSTVGAGTVFEISLPMDSQ